MPRDVCAISEDLSPGCATVCAYDASVRRLYGYDGSGDLFREHAYLDIWGHYTLSDIWGHYTYIADYLNSVDKGLRLQLK